MVHWRFSMRGLLLLLSAVALLLGMAVLWPPNDGARIVGSLEEDFASEDRALEVLNAMVLELGSTGFSETPQRLGIGASSNGVARRSARALMKTHGRGIGQKVDCRIVLAADENSLHIQVSAAGRSRDAVERWYHTIFTELERNVEAAAQK